MENINPWKTLKTRAVYNNKWINVHEHEIINPAGNNGIYGVVNFNNYAIGIIPLDEFYNTWIVGQYRYTLNNYSWENPQGGGPKDIDPLESGKRELLEECGIIANEWIKIAECFTSNSVTDEKGIIYVAKQLQFTEAAPEETEQLCIKKLPFSSVFSMAMNGEITCNFALSAILKTKFLIDKGIL